LDAKLDWTPKAYIEATHVKFLESAGARVLPVPFDLSPTELKKLMTKLNGLYIPGDHESLLADSQYSRTIAAIVQYAQKINEEEGNHFPVVGFEYGALTMLQDAAKDRDFGKAHAPQHVGKRFHFEALKHPDQTLMFDAVR
jgi:hypothetical protein